MQYCRPQLNPFFFPRSWRFGGDRNGTNMCFYRRHLIPAVSSSSRWLNQACLQGRQMSVNPQPASDLLSWLGFLLFQSSTCVSLALSHLCFGSPQVQVAIHEWLSPTVTSQSKGPRVTWPRGRREGHMTQREEFLPWCGEKVLLPCNKAPLNAGLWLRWFIFQLWTPMPDRLMPGRLDRWSTFFALSPISRQLLATFFRVQFDLQQWFFFVVVVCIFACGAAEIWLYDSSKDQ